MISPQTAKITDSDQYWIRNEMEPGDTSPSSAGIAIPFDEGPNTGLAKR
jgi:hypothetical protein